MGLLRLFLAITIVLWHTGTIAGYRFIDTRISIHSFYIISGFYITFILNEKYVHKKGSYWLYITNRLLRIYPLYWAILTATVCTSLLMGHREFLHVNVSEVIKNMSLVVSREYFVLYDTHSIFVVAPAWTLGLEVLFYMLAPFIVRRSWWQIMIVTAASIILRKVIFYPQYVTHGYISNRYIITELCFFLFGAIAYSFYRYIKSREILRNTKMVYGVVLFTMGIVSFWSYGESLMNNIALFEWLYYGYLIVALPFLFEYANGRKWDALLGSLSYPVYLSNMMILWWVRSTLQPRPDTLQNIVILAVTVAFSLALVYVIERPLNRYRQRRISV